MFHRWQRSRCARLISYPVSNSRCQAVSFGWLPWPVVPNNDVEARVGGFISGVRHAVAAQAITARRFRFQRFPVPGVHASPHQPKRRIEVGLSVEAGLWSGQGPHPPIAPPLGRPWGLSIVQIPSHQEIGPTPALHPIRRVVVVTEACGRTRQGGEMHPRPHPPFRVPSTRGGLESDGTDWIPGVALCVLADSSLRCTCAGLDCGEGDRLMILPRYRGQERSGCNLYSVF